MKDRCHAMPKAKASPKILRLDSTHLVNLVGHKTAVEDAVKAMRKNGTAQRTEYKISCSSPLEDERSVKGSRAAIATVIAAASNQKRRQPLMIPDTINPAMEVAASDL